MAEDEKLCAECAGTGECQECDGFGDAPYLTECPTCGGSGIINEDEDDEAKCPDCDGFGGLDEICDVCFGTGECQECDGSGVEEE